MSIRIYYQSSEKLKKIDKKYQVLVISKLEELANNSNNIKPLKGNNYFRLRVANL